MELSELVGRLTDAPWYRGQIVERRDRPARDAEFCDDWSGVPEEVRRALGALGIDRLYAHQRRGLDAIGQGHHTVLTAGPASGKSLCFQVPAVAAARRTPPENTLIVGPYKSVEQARRRVFERLARHLPELRSRFAVHDGDAGASDRAHAHRRPVLITNPDMLHRSMLPEHPRWARFFGRLRYVVLEELHCYSGLLGANAANLFRRLWRVCRHYGADPQLIATSSTLPNPCQLAELVTGRSARVVGGDSSPRGPRACLLWDPATDPPSHEAGLLVARLVEAGAGTIAFSRSRTSCELIAKYAAGRLAEDSPGKEDAVRAFRGGYRPSERRAIEEGLHDGTVRGVSSTNALELGLHVPGLDAAVICGWPGSLASFRQQAARVGRSGRPSLVVFMGLKDPVNQFLLRHPEYLFDRPVESGVVERANPHVLAGHLRCAARELPLKDEEVREFGENAPRVLRVLEDRRKVRRGGGCWLDASRDSPARELPLRGYFDKNVTVHDRQSGEVVGEVDWMGAHSLVHRGAIYLHGDTTYLVEEFDRGERRACVRAVDVPYYTNPLGHCYVESVDECLEERRLPGGPVFTGEVTAGALTEGYEKRRYRDNGLIQTLDVDIPPVLWETMAVWLCLSNVREAELSALGLSPDYYGLGNALRIVLPLFMTCNVLDMRPWPGRTNFPWTALYFYERYPRGLGFSRRVFGRMDDVLAAAEQNVRGCRCGDGCPLCVGDPVRPYIVNNPELEADRIPSRREALLLLCALRSDEPMEDLLFRVFGRPRAEEMLDGRLELLRHRRREAAGEPPRRLPADAPLPGNRGRDHGLPLQVERGVRRRLEKMRTAETPGETEPVRQARTPRPEPESDLSQADPESRHRGRLRQRLAKRKKSARAEQTPRDDDGGTTDERLAQRAVRRLRRRKDRRGSEE